MILMWLYNLATLLSRGEILQK